MERALSDAGVSADQVRYVNLHGTGTRANDAMESNAVHRLLPEATVSSTKPFTGHCLGAAGAVEAAICCMALEDEQHRLPAHIFDGHTDPSLPPLHIGVPEVPPPAFTEGQCYLSNSFAFGGSNCTLALRRTAGGAE
jgi:3-oxoacyl-[acyl-carrier-protein] synthase I